MQSPINEIDFQRFIKLAKLIKENATDIDNLKIYISDTYVSLEINGHKVPKEKIKEIISIPIDKLFI